MGRNFKKEKTGFTLIELLLVIAIIGIFVGIVVVYTGTAKTGARDVRRQNDLRQLANAQEQVMSDDKEYFKAPAQDGVPPIKNSLNQTYLIAINDPQGSGNPYKWLANNAPIQGCEAGKFYCAFAVLENNDCPVGQIKYFAVSEKGTRQFCDSAVPEYGASDCACF